MPGFECRAVFAGGRETEDALLSIAPQFTTAAERTAAITADARTRHGRDQGALGTIFTKYNGERRKERAKRWGHNVEHRTMRGRERDRVGCVELLARAMRRIRQDWPEETASWMRASMKANAEEEGLGGGAGLDVVCRRGFRGCKERYYTSGRFTCTHHSKSCNEWWRKKKAEEALRGAAGASPAPPAEKKKEREEREVKKAKAEARKGAPKGGAPSQTGRGRAAPAPAKNHRGKRSGAAHAAQAAAKPGRGAPA
eukprot:gene6566-12890_t